jgi:hypothetical protein
LMMTMAGPIDRVLRVPAPRIIPARRRFIF